MSVTGTVGEGNAVRVPEGSCEGDGGLGVVEWLSDAERDRVAMCRAVAVPVRRPLSECEVVRL